MAAPRGRRSTARGGDEPRDDTPSGGRSDAAGRVPELLRRAIGLGFAGFFTGEEFLRKALGETVPREWVEFAAAQSERTRRELAERIAAEVGRSLQSVDLPALLEQLLRGHTLEVSARIRFVPRGEDAAAEDPDAIRLRFGREEDS